jgi:hypothetical protein
MTFFGVAVLTAIGTVVLAVFAVVTAWYARKAFREQSREVAAIEQQVKGEQEITRQQAELLKVQTGPLEALREQVEAQRDTTAAQAEATMKQAEASARQAVVLELQAAELRESLEERKREGEQRRTAQAAKVFLVQKNSRNTSNMRMEANVFVRNASEMPVYDAELVWRRGSSMWGDPNPEPLGVILPGDSDRRLRQFAEDTNMDVSGAVLRFKDAAGVRWIRRPDGYLGEQE